MRVAYVRCGGPRDRAYLTAEASTVDELARAYAAEGVDAPPDLAARADDARRQLSELAAAWAEVPGGGQLVLDWPG